MKATMNICDLTAKAFLALLEIALFPLQYQHNSVSLFRACKIFIFQIIFTGFNCELQAVFSAYVLMVCVCPVLSLIAM